MECLKEAYQSRITYLRNLGPGAAFSLEGLAGEWTRVETTQQESSHLTVDAVSADGFGFTIGATHAMTDGPITADDFTYHVGEIEGVATRRAGTAVYLDEDTQCRVTFTREGDGRLVVGTSPECAGMGGLGVTFNGDYRKAER